MNKILVVCMGNICRSPTAEIVLRSKAEESELMLEIDSAGTHAYHVGHEPDARSVMAARQRGYDLSSLQARKVTKKDFDYFDVVLAMDSVNIQALEKVTDDDQSHKIKLLTAYSERYLNSDVPDPYYGGSNGFEVVLDIIEDAAVGLIRHIHENN